MGGLVWVRPYAPGIPLQLYPTIKNNARHADHELSPIVLRSAVGWGVGEGGFPFYNPLFKTGLAYIALNTLEV